MGLPANFVSFVLFFMIHSLRHPLSFFSRIATARPHSCIAPTFDSKSGDPHFLAFLVRCLDHSGAIESILFQDLSMERLTIAEFAILHSNPHFQWRFTSPMAGTALMNLIGENAKDCEPIAVRDWQTRVKCDFRAYFCCCGG
jgi:hypothetical protein